MTAGPELNVAFQKQLTHYANCEWRRSAGDEDSHHLRRCSQTEIRNNIAL